MSEEALLVNLASAYQTWNAFIQEPAHPRQRVYDFFSFPSHVDMKRIRSDMHDTYLIVLLQRPCLANPIYTSRDSNRVISVRLKNIHSLCSTRTALMKLEVFSSNFISAVTPFSWCRHEISNQYSLLLSDFIFYSLCSTTHL